MISKTWTRGTMNCSMNCLQYKLQSRPQQKVHLCMSKAPSDEKRERPGVFIGILNFPLGQLLGSWNWHRNLLLIQKKSRFFH